MPTFKLIILCTHDRQLEFTYPVSVFHQLIDIVYRSLAMSELTEMDMISFHVYFKEIKVN